MDKIICPNCGAVIKGKEPKCPFCGYINVSGAEEKFMQDLKQTEEQLNQIPKEQEKQYKKSMLKSSRVIVITVLIAGIIAAVLIGLYFLLDNLFSSHYEYDPKVEMIWERENYPLLDELYEAGDYAGILEFEENMYHQNEEEGTNHSIYNWEHSDFIDAYRKFEDIKHYEAILTEEGELSKYEAELVVYYCMWFHYRNYQNVYGEFTEQELEILEEYSAYADRIFYERLLFTDEEADALYEEVLNYGSISASECFKYARKIKDRFK